MAPGTVKPYMPPSEPLGKVNITDPDSRNLKAFRGYVQGYNAQAVVTDDQVVIAAEIKTTPTDFGFLGPMLDVTRRNLQQIGVTQAPGVVVADSRLLAQRADGRTRRRRCHRADSARLKQTKERSTGVERRSLRVDATPPRDRHRSTALRQTPQSDRARLWPDQVQPTNRPVLTKRPARGVIRMAASYRHPQPPQAPPPPHRASHGLTGRP